MPDKVTQQIEFEFIANTRKLLDSVLGALGLIEKEREKIKPFDFKFSTDFEKAQAELFKLVSAYDKLKNEAAKYNDIISKITVNQKEQAPIMHQIDQLMNNFGISAQKAGQIILESGQVELTVLQKVLSLMGERLLSTQQVEAAIGKLRERMLGYANSEGLVEQAGKKVSDSQNKIRESTDKAGAGFDNITSRVKSLLAAFGIVGSLQTFINFLKDATKAGIDFAQAQFNLGVQVRAAQRAIGVEAAGSMDVWREKIKSLRQELGIFSETDITKAVTQTSVLTRVIGLNADKQEEVIRLASVLAQTTGTDLAQAVDDVTKALGGSSVVLDKYGLFIRDTDKAAAAFELGFTDKLQSGTNGLTSQQLALATLQTVIKQVNPLMEELTGFQATLPGQVKATQAQIDDTVKDIGLKFADFGLLLKNIYAGLLDTLNDVLNNPFVQWLNEQVKVINDYIKLKRDLDNITTKTAKTVEYKGGFQTSINDMINQNKRQYNNLSGFGFAEPLQTDVATGIKYYQSQYLRVMGATEDSIKQYEEEVKKAIEEAHKELQPEYDKLFGIKPPQKGGLSPDERQERNDATKAAAEMTDLQKKLGEELVKAWDEKNKDIIKAEQDKNKALIDASHELMTGLIKLNADYDEKRKKLDLEAKRKREDIDRNHARDEAKLEDDINHQREQIQQESADKTAEIWADYYRKLGELNNQFYYDLRDAVADNDAVAIKKLERKYALDKQKLDDNLADQLDNQQDATQRRLRDLEEETRRRREELNTRYEQELEDLEIWKKREADDNLAWFRREYKDLQDKYSEQVDLASQNYNLQIQLINAHYQERLVEITDSLAKEYTATEQNFKDMLKLYEEYLGTGGSITNLVKEFFDYQNRLAGGENATGGAGGGTGGTGGNGGGGTGVRPTFATAMNRENQIMDTNLQNRLYNVVVSSDGSIGDVVIDSIAKNLSDVIENVLVSRGGYQRGR